MYKIESLPAIGRLYANFNSLDLDAVKAGWERMHLDVPIYESH